MANKKFVLLGLVLPILVFFISYSAVFAYFTATSNHQAQTLSAIVKIGFQDNQNAQKISHEVQTNGATSESTNIMPGDTLITNSTIVNEGNVDVYSIFNFKITIEKKDGATVTDVDDYYTFTTDGSLTKLVAQNGIYTDPACKLTPKQTVEISVSKYFKGSVYGNEYKNAKVTYAINALAIQTAGLGTPANATNMLINNQNGVNKNLQIFGGSVQNGTPTPETPVEIQSVGDKTKNLWGYGGLNTTDNANGMFSFNLTGTYTLSFELNYETYKEPSAALFQLTVDGVSKVISPYNIIMNGWQKQSTTVTGNLTAIRLVNWGSVVGDIINIQLEEGDTVTAYEPYGKYKISVKASNGSEEQITNIYLDQPLRKIGEYADYIDFATGTVVRNVRSLELAIADMNNDSNKPGWKDLDIMKSDFSGYTDTALASLTSVLCNVTDNSQVVKINTSGSNSIIYLDATILGPLQEDWIETSPNLVVNICYGITNSEIEVVELPDLLSYTYDSITVNTSVTPSLVIYQK